MAYTHCTCGLHYTRPTHTVPVAYTHCTYGLRKALIVRDDNELEVVLVTPAHHHTAQGLRQAAAVLWEGQGGQGGGAW